jgi:small subunit ribosomal protein S1
MRDLFDDDDNSAGKNGTEDFARMFEESLQGLGRKLAVGDKIRSEVLTVGKEEVFVSTGTVDDGVVLVKDLTDEQGQVSAKVGDFLDLYVTRVHGNQIFLSPKPTAKNLSEDLEDAFDMMLPVEGRVSEVVNGGFRVQILGKTAFCPISQIDLRRVEDQQSYIGKKMEFLITQFDPKGRNIVVSRKKLLLEQKEISVAAFAEENQVGSMVEGTVTRLEKFGAFVEIAPGLEGLCHISELAWARVSDPAEVLKIGQTVSAKILKIEEGMNGRLNVSLSIKQASPTPWENLPQHVREGSLVKGRVERREQYGLFVRIADGLTGLLPKAKVIGRPDFSFDKVQVGDEIAVVIDEIRQDERRISLGLPGDPEAGAWKEFASAKTAASGLGTLGEQFKNLFEQGASQQISKKNKK